MIKLLIGGSPCTFWSVAQKKGRETEAEGLGWELFNNYLIAKKKFNPDFFLYENNKSASQAIKDQISRELGVPIMHINSSLVSAQNRQRFYAFNWEVEQPEDRGIVLRDILETSPSERAYDLVNVVGEPIYVGEVPGHNGVYRNGKQPSQQYRVYSVDGKSVACDQDSRKFVAEPINVTTDEKAFGLKAQYHKSAVANFLNGCNHYPQTGVAEPIRIGDIGSIAQAHRVYSPEGKNRTLIANAGGQGGKTGLYAIPVGGGKEQPVYEVKDGIITINGKEHPIKLPDGYYIIRKLTPIECERLQTLPDNYTAAVSNAQRYRGLGNGWTAEVIIHILNGALKDVPSDEEIVVLSMYDGIGTGRYCLDKMGFTNVRYYAYEIDKFAKQVAKSNYPDIIHMGDAFDLRHPDWTIGY